MPTISFSAPAKINLHLRVAPIDPATGFHPLMSWMSTVGLFDTLDFEPIDNATGRIMLTCSEPTIPADERNLVYRAAAALKQASGVSQSVSIHLTKHVPHGGGLGGGSSDAATTLLALNRLWKLDYDVTRLSGIAATLGSDVPFFLHGPSSVCTGRGEHVRPVARPAPRWVVLILPGLSIPTPAVYRKFDEMGFGSVEQIERQPDWSAWAELSAGPLLEGLVNDLEPPAFAICPALAALRAEIEQSIGRIVRMSGSGSSLFTLYDDESAAKAVADQIATRLGTRAVAVELAPR